MEILYTYYFIFMAGLCLGSFANVLIYRLPLGISIFRPGSKCPSCNTPIKWHDNIPVLSYFLLKARCRNCSSPIPVTYLIVELLVPLTLVIIRSLSGNPVTFLIFGFFSFMITVISFIDLKHNVIPDSLSISTALVGFLISPFNASLGAGAVLQILNSLLGIISGGLIMYLTGVMGARIFKKDALGGGDIKLMAAAGAFLGWRGIIISLFFGSLLGTLVSVLLIYAFKTKNWGDYVPYGPFLSTGILIDIFFFVL